MTVAAISINGLGKTYRKGWKGTPVAALRDMSLRVEEGETFGFVGPNGAGKSTTIKILIGIAEATTGSAEIFGVPVGNPLARRGIGYVPENPYLYDHLTPMEILTMGLHLHESKVANPAQHCRKWLERLDLGDVASKPIRTFSKGMTQRVTLAQALCISPRLLVLDEPLSGLDPIGRRDVVEILSEYRNSGGTLFFTSHVLHDVERLADRFGLIHQGELRAVRSPAELTGEEERVVIRSFGVAGLDWLTADSGGRWQAEVPSKDLWPRLEQLQVAGHSLIEVRPTLSLEAAFLRVVHK